MRDDSSPPPELTLAWLCGNNHLPDTGGMMDQDYTTITRMRKARNIYNAFYRFTYAQGEQIHQLTASERAIVRMLKEGGYI